jgi:hypothetical protein
VNAQVCRSTENSGAWFCVADVHSAMREHEIVPVHVVRIAGPVRNLDIFPTPVKTPLATMMLLTPCNAKNPPGSAEGSSGLHVPPIGLGPGKLQSHDAL